jgi:7-dehydrocholesterol reductase
MENIENMENVSIIKNYIAPLSLMIILPILLILLLKKYATASSKNIYPNTFSLGVLVVLLLWGYSSIKFFPKNFEGPTNLDGITPKYQGNGFVFWVITTVITGLICFFVPTFPIKFTENFISIIITFAIFGFIFVFYLYLKDRNTYWDKDEDDKKGYSDVFRFYRGLSFHPTVGGVDVKQLTNCRFGMIGWQIIITIFAFFSYYNYGLNTAMAVSFILQSLYIAKFFFWETGYFNTLDITLDRAGYYICWGCIVFVPAFYTFASYYLANNPSKIPLGVGALFLALGIAFIWLNYDVDAQKEAFKKDNGVVIWGKKAEYISDADTEGEGGRKLLTSGWWGVSRHINYVFEIGLSACWCGVALKLPPLAYLAYIIILLVHRTFRDEEKCAKKYGKLWKQYSKKVRYYMIPKIF